MKIVAYQERQSKRYSLVLRKDNGYHYHVIVADVASLLQMLEDSNVPKLDNTSDINVYISALDAEFERLY